MHDVVIEVTENMLDKIIARRNHLINQLFHTLERGTFFGNHTFRGVKKHVDIPSACTFKKK
jgi:hypothetical protein